MFLNKKNNEKISEKIKEGKIIKQNLFETKNHGIYCVQIVLLNGELYFVKQKTDTQVSEDGVLTSTWQIVEIMNLTKECKKQCWFETKEDS